MTILNQGDVAVIGFQADTPDAFSVVFLADADTSHSISFTEMSWTDGNSFFLSEGNITWTPPQAINAGDVVSFVETGNSTSGGEGLFNIFINGTAAGSIQASRPDGSGNFWSTASGGDQIFVYQGTPQNPSLIWGTDFDKSASEGAWSNVAAGTGGTNSTRPAAGDLNQDFSPAYVNINTANDQYRYSGTTSGGISDLQAAIANPANWTTQETPFSTATNTDPFPTISFTVAAPGNPPTVDVNTGSTAVEGGSDTITSAELDTNDSDTADASITYSLDSSVNSGTLFIDNNNNGSFQAGTDTNLAAGGTFTQADINASRLTYVNDGGENTADSFVFDVSDGSAAVENQTFNITITGVNDAPAVANLDGDARTFLAVTGFPIVLDNNGDASVSDVDDANFNGGSLTVSLGVSGLAEDQLIIGNLGNVAANAGFVQVGGNLIGTYPTSGAGSGVNGADLVITFTDNAANSGAVAELVSAIQYDNTASTVTGGNRSITTVLNDGDDDSNVSTVTMTVTPAPNADPAIANLDGDSITFIERGDPANLDDAGNATVTDSDSMNLAGGTLTVEFTSGAQSQDYLLFDTSGSVSTSGNDLLVNGTTVGSRSGGFANDLVISLTAAATPASAQALIRALQYTSDDLDNPIGGQRTFTVTLTDGDGGTSNSSIITLTVNATNDDPQIQSLPSDITVTFGQTSDVDFTSAFFFDPDSGNDPVELTIAAGDGILTASDSGGVTVTGSGTGSITLQGTESSIDGFLVQSSNIQYSGAMGAVGENADILTLTANDGGSNGSGGGTSVSLGTVNVDIEVDLTPVPQGADQQVNTTAFTTMRKPEIAALEDGGFIVTWTASPTGQSLEVYGQRYDATGTAVGVEFQVNSNSTGFQQVSDTAALPNGGFIVTYQSSGVTAQIFDATGMAVGNEIVVGTGNEPSVETFSDNSFIVSYSGVAPSTDLFAQRYDAAGAPVGSAAQINTFTHPTTSRAFSDIAVFSDDSYVVTWQSDFQDNFTTGIYGQRFGSDGAPLGGEFQINSFSPGTQALPSVAVLNDGGFVVTWQSSNQISGSGTGIYGQRYDTAGTAAGGEFLVSNIADNQLVSTTTALSGGGFVVTWSSADSNGLGMFGQRYGTDGSPQGTVFQLNSNETSDQTSDLQHGAEGVVELANGDLAAVWSSFSLGNVFVRLISVPSAPNTPPVVATNDGLQTQEGGTDTITSTALDTNDAEQADGLITYSLDTVTTNGDIFLDTDGSGSLDNGEVALAAGGTFTQADIEAGRLIYTHDSTETVTDQFQFDVTDGTVSVDDQTFNIVVAPVDDPAIAVDDAFGVLETGTIVAGDLFAANPTTADSDVDSPLAVTAVNGAAGDVGTQVTLASGALVTANANGTFDYDPNGAFVSLTGGAMTTDTFAYELNGGPTATVTVTIMGETGDGDVITGTPGNDVLIAHGGVQTLVGLAGDDLYAVDQTGDMIIEAAGEGQDTVYSTATFTLPDNVETIVLQGGDDLDATGNAGDNQLIGNAGANILNGGGGADQFAGSGGNDTYIVDGPEDSVFEAAGEGNDTVLSSTTWGLSANVENLTLTGSLDIAGFGNELANTITGNDGFNYIDGGAGTDIMTGGAGDDIYVVDNSADLAIEAAGEGQDTLFSTVDYVLGDNIEVLVLNGTAVQGFGNDLDNQIIGNSETNVLLGGQGTDYYVGGSGNDIFVIGKEAAMGDLDVIADFSGAGVAGGDAIGFLASDFGSDGIVTQVSTTSFIVSRADGTNDQQFILADHDGTALTVDDYYFG